MSKTSEIALFISANAAWSGKPLPCLVCYNLVCYAFLPGTPWSGKLVLLCPPSGDLEANCCGASELAPLLPLPNKDNTTKQYQ